MGFTVLNGAGEAKWQGGWTIFYWGWWISWAPFVGLFIARISRGRTIREFMIGVMFVPTTPRIFLAVYPLVEMPYTWNSMHRGELAPQVLWT